MRADFPHDSYWKKARVSFSNHKETEISLNKTSLEQVFLFNSINTSCVKLDNLVVADPKNNIAALTQIKVWGRNIER